MVEDDIDEIIILEEQYDALENALNDALYNDISTEGADPNMIIAALWSLIESEMTKVCPTCRASIAADWIEQMLEYANNTVQQPDICPNTCIVFKRDAARAAKKKKKAKA